MILTVVALPVNLCAVFWLDVLVIVSMLKCYSSLKLKIFHEKIILWVIHVQCKFCRHRDLIIYQVKEELGEGGMFVHLIQINYKILAAITPIEEIWLFQLIFIIVFVMYCCYVLFGDTLGPGLMYVFRNIQLCSSNFQFSPPSPKSM